jgi:hypothetical protein
MLGLVRCELFLEEFMHHQVNGGAVSVGASIRVHDVAIFNKEASVGLDGHT